MIVADGSIYLAYLAVGAVAGVVGGLLGLGGGIIVVPALLFLFAGQQFPSEYLMHLAVATSLFTIIFTSMAAGVAHHKMGAILWPRVRLLAPGLVVGAVLGALVADQLHSEVLRRVFGLFELLVAVQIGFSLHPRASRNAVEQRGSTAEMLGAGGVIGALSTLLGIGGGTLTIPFLVWRQIDLRRAVATSVICGFPIAVVGSLMMMVTGADHRGQIAGSIGYVHGPAALAILASSILCAPFAARLAHRLPVQTLKRVFALVLGVIGLRMLW